MLMVKSRSEVHSICHSTGERWTIKHCVLLCTHRKKETHRAMSRISREFKTEKVLIWHCVLVIYNSGIWQHIKPSFLTENARFQFWRNLAELGFLSCRLNDYVIKYNNDIRGSLISKCTEHAGIWSELEWYSIDCIPLPRPNLIPINIIHYQINLI